MGDAKDILGLKKDALLQPTREKKGKEAAKKPDGISREVFALTGGAPPIMPATEGGWWKSKKKGASSGEKVRWGWLPIQPAGRTDIKIFHWAKIVEGSASEKYSFDKYDKQVDMVSYSEDEYSQYLTDSKWTREETDYLFELLHQYDLRFIIVADRWNMGKDRSVEDLKERYYNIARRLTLARAHHDESADQHPLAKDPFNVAHEIERKKALKLLLEQSKQQEREEQEVIAEAKQIAEARRIDLEKEGPPPPAPQEPPRPAPTPTAARSQHRQPKPPPPPVATAPPPPPPKEASTPRTQTSSQAGTPLSASTPPHKHLPKVYIRGTKLAAWVAQQAQSQGGRIAKRVDASLEELGLKSKPSVPSRAVCAEYEHLRKGITYLLNGQRKLQAKQAELVALREAAKDGSLARQLAQGYDKRPVSTRATASADPEASEGAPRIGKRSEKRKAPARFSDDAGPLSPSDSLGPSQKRARKLKVPDD